MTERKLVTVRKIAALDSIPGADAIQVATVDGWKVVVRVGEFNVGDYCCYAEIDSFIPTEIAPFLSKGQEPRVFEGIRGERLRTIRLRGQISQGLLLPYSILGRIASLGEDVTDELGVKKWEAPIPAELAGQVKGVFPNFAIRSDQERIQNLVQEVFIDNADSSWEVSMKLDGTSVTYYSLSGGVGACSRNLELKVNEENKDNSIVKLLTDSRLRDLLPEIDNIAIQGELLGNGIQGNREGLKGQKFFIYNIQDLTTRRFVSPEERMSILNRLYELGVKQELVSHVPVLHIDVSLADLGITNVAELLTFAEGPSLVHAVREGLVFKRLDGGFSFKAISNKFLEKEKD